MRCAGFFFPFFFLLRLADFCRGTKRHNSETERVPQLRRSKRSVHHSALSSALLRRTFQCASIKRRLSRSDGRTRWCGHVSQPTKGRQKVQLAALCCSTGLRFLFHSLLLSAWSVLSSTALHHQRVIVECAKSILGAAGRLLKEHRTKGGLPTLRCTNTFTVAAASPPWRGCTSCLQHAAQTVKEKKHETSPGSSNEKFLQCRRLLLPF